MSHGYPNVEEARRGWRATVTYRDGFVDSTALDQFEVITTTVSEWASAKQLWSESRPHACKTESSILLSATRDGACFYEFPSSVRIHVEGASTASAMEATADDLHKRMDALVLALDARPLAMGEVIDILVQFSARVLVLAGHVALDEP